MKTLFIAILCGLTVSCVDRGRMTATQSPDVQQIPRSIAVYPLLTTELPRPQPQFKSIRAMTLEKRDRDLFIEAPAESKLVVNMQSQLLTGLLSGDLAHHGFKLKELPIETPDSGSDKTSFTVSLDLLKRLKRDYGTEAVLIGNIYFARDSYDASKYMVKAAYLKLVDAETLDILCHISMNHEYEGFELEEAAWSVAAELASMAKLAPAEVGPSPSN